MHSSADDKQPSLQEWDHTTSTSMAGMVVRLNNTADTIGATGWGTTAETSTSCFYNIGYRNQHAIAVMRFVSPTTAANCNMGIMLRSQSLDATTDTDYIYVRVNGGDAQIVRFADGSAAETLFEDAFVLPADTDVTIEAWVIDDVITATWRASGVPDVDGVASAASHTGLPPQRPGFIGARCTSRTMLVRQFSAEYL